MSIYVYLDGTNHEIVDIVEDTHTLLLTLDNGTRWYTFMNETDAKKWLYGLFEEKAYTDKDAFFDYLGSEPTYQALKSCVCLTKLLENVAIDYFNKHMKLNASAWSQMYPFLVIIPYPLECWWIT